MSENFGRLTDDEVQRRKEDQMKSGTYLEASEPTAFIRADYKEWHPETFKGFMVEIEGEEHGAFSGYEDALRFASANADRVFNTSSVDHYKSDLARGMAH